MMKKRNPVESVHFWASDKSVSIHRKNNNRTYENVSFSSRSRLEKLAREKSIQNKWFVRPSIFGWIAFTPEASQ